MVGFLKFFGYFRLGKYIFLTQNIFSSAPTLGINSDQSLISVKALHVPSDPGLRCPGLCETKNTCIREQ